MKYMGSKNRIAKELLVILLRDRKDGQWYVEPFVGGANVIDKVDGLRLGADNNKYLIALYKGLQEGLSFKTEITKELYSLARNQYNTNLGTFSDFEIGYIGYMGSANGRFYEGGYSGKSNTKIGTVRDYIAESIKGINKQLPKLLDIRFECCSYYDLVIPDNSIIYCDPPYQNTKAYATSRDFDSDLFWGWCRDKTKQGHTVFISEYQAPEDFTCVWQKEVKSSISANSVTGGSVKTVERLFTYADA